MAISESHASHIGRVAVSYSISGPAVEPDALTAQLGIAPSTVFRAGEPRRNAAGNAIGVHMHGFWALSSTGAIDSKDVNQHFAVVLQRLLPHAAILRELATGGESYVDVWWESSYLYAGTGPLLTATSVQAAADLGAAMNFDIYQIDEPAV